MELAEEKCRSPVQTDAARKGLRAGSAARLIRLFCAGKKEHVNEARGARPALIAGFACSSSPPAALTASIILHSGCPWCFVSA